MKCKYLSKKVKDLSSQSFPAFPSFHASGSIKGMTIALTLAIAIW